MNTLEQGRLGEAKAITYFVEAGYDVFVPAFGNAVCDFIVTKDNHVKRVEVKTSSTKAPSGNYIVQLRSVRSNRSGSVVNKFDASKTDYLVVYIHETDLLMVYDAETYHGRSTLTV